MNIIDKGDDGIPSALPRLTKVQLAINAEQQEMWARQHPTQGDKRAMNAQARIKELEALTLLTADQREKLAESYAVVGQFEKAAKTTVDKEKQAKWLQTWKAVWKSKPCKCPDVITNDTQGRPQKVEQQHPVRMVFSHKENKEVLLSRCINCDNLTTNAEA